MYCQQCGAKNQDGAKFCANCGKELTITSDVNVSKPKERKKNKKVIIGSLLTIIGIVAIVVGIIAIKNNISGEYKFSKEERQAYTSMIDFSYIWDSDEDYNFCFYDINNDKIPELIASEEIYNDYLGKDIIKIMAFAYKQGSEEEGSDIDYHNVSRLVYNGSLKGVEFYPRQGIFKTYGDAFLLNTDDMEDSIHYYKIVKDDDGYLYSEEIDEEEVEVNSADAVYVEDMEMQKATKKSVRDYFNEHMK